jgi:hypothetical protein
MSIKNLQIDLNKKNSVFFTGDTIIGRLTFQVTERMRIKSLKLYVNGWCQVEFLSGKIGGTVKAAEKYMQCELKFVTSETSSPEIYLEQGNYSYEFEVKLPENLPSSLASRWGEISYNLDAVFEMPWTFNKRHVQPLTLINLTDLSKNFKPSMPEEYFVKGNKVYGCCCCASSPVETKLVLDKNAYAIGETINCHAFINNKSPRTLKQLQAYLVRTCTFITPKQKNTLTKMLDVAELKQVISSGTDFEWTNVKLKVPFTQPSTIQTSKVIKIEYSVFLKLVVDAFFSLNYAHGIIVTIGCIPCTGDENEKKPSFEIKELNASPFNKLS